MRIATFLILVVYTNVSAQHVSQEMLKPLESLLGSWQVDANMRLSKTGPWDKSVAKSVIKMSIGESVLEEDYRGTKEGRAFIVRTFLANDNRTKRYQRMSIDSDHGVLVLYEGEFKSDTLTLKAQLQMPDYKLDLRVQYFFISADKVVMENARSTDLGKTWDMTSQLTYNRMK